MVEKAVKSLLEEKKALEKELSQARSKLAIGAGRRSRFPGGRREEGAKVLAATLDGADAKTLRETMDKLKDRLKSAAIVLGAVNDGKVSLIAGRHRRPDREGEGGRAGQLRRAAGRRQGRRPARHGAGRRHRPGRAAERAAVGEILGRAARMKALLFAMPWPFRSRPWRTTVGASTTPRRCSSSPARSSRPATSIRTVMSGSKRRARPGR